MTRFIKILFIIIIGTLLLMFAKTQKSDNKTNDITESSYDSQIENQYGYAYMTPHGGFWQDLYFSTLDECDNSLKERLKIGGKTNTKTCYNAKFVSAWCIEGIRTNQTRTTDTDSKKSYFITKTVCTETKEQCEQMKQYQDKKASSKDCFNTKVFDRESEALYLTPKHEIDDIIKTATL